jgi:hypothetical protein
MNTDDLIRALSADNATRHASVEQWLAAALLPGLAASAALFALILGLRADIAAVATDFGFLFKFIVTLTLAATAAFAALRLARPGRKAGVAAVALALAPVMLAAVVLAEFAQAEVGTRLARLFGATWLYCLASIPLLSAPILVAALFALRHGAPTRPASAGAIAGLIAGGLGAAIYALHCPENSSFFLAAWYSAAIAFVALIGALLGARALRW